MRPIDADELISNKFKNPISYQAFVNLVKRQPTIEIDDKEVTSKAKAVNAPTNWESFDDDL